MCLQVTRQSVSLLAKNWQYCLLTNLLILKFNKKENVSKKMTSALTANHHVMSGDIVHETCQYTSAKCFHTCFVRITDRAADSLSGVSCVLLRPWFTAPFSINISLEWNFVKPGDLCIVPWLCPKFLELIPEGNLKREDENQLKKKFRNWISKI